MQFLVMLSIPLSSKMQGVLIFTALKVTFDFSFCAAMEEDTSASDFEAFLSDKKFTYFVDEFKKELSSFERAKEWADLIKSLQKLTRVRFLDFQLLTSEGSDEVSAVPSGP